MFRPASHTGRHLHAYGMHMHGCVVLVGNKPRLGVTAAAAAHVYDVQVPPKFYRYNASVVWSPPVDTPISWVPGPSAMAKVSAK